MLDLAKEKIEAVGPTNRASSIRGFVDDLPIGTLYEGAALAMVYTLFPMTVESKTSSHYRLTSQTGRTVDAWRPYAVLKAMQAEQPNTQISDAEAALVVEN